MTPEPNPASDTAREAAERCADLINKAMSDGLNSPSGEASFDLAPTIQTAIDDSTAALRREVEELRAERAQITPLTNGDIRLVIKLTTERDAALQQVAELTRERDEARIKEGVAHADFMAISEYLDEAKHELENVWKPAAAMNSQYAEAYKAERDAALARAEAGEQDTARIKIIERFHLTVGRAGYRGRDGWEVTEANPGGHYQEERRRTIGYGETANEALDKAVEYLTERYGVAAIGAATGGTK